MNTQIWIAVRTYVLIAALARGAASTGEAEKNEPELDIPVEIERRQARQAAIEAAKVRLEGRQREADTQRGRSDHDERRSKGKEGKAKGATTSSVTWVCHRPRPRSVSPTLSPQS